MFQHQLSGPSHAAGAPLIVFGPAPHTASVCPLLDLQRTHSRLELADWVSFVSDCKVYLFLLPIHFRRDHTHVKRGRLFCWIDLDQALFDSQFSLFALSRRHEHSTDGI